MYIRKSIKKFEKAVNNFKNQNTYYVKKNTSRSTQSQWWLGC